MTIDDAYIVEAGAVVWGATASIVAVLWARIRVLEKTVAKLQAEKAEGDAAKVMIDSCPSPSCPFASAVGLLFCLCLVSCAPKTQEARHFDKSVLIVFRNESPSNSGGVLGAIIEPLKPLLKFVLP